MEGGFIDSIFNDNIQKRRYTVKKPREQTNLYATCIIEISIPAKTKKNYDNEEIGVVGSKKFSCPQDKSFPY